MSIQWNTVTWYSKLAAVIVFAGVLYLGFYIGSEYEKIKPEIGQPVVVNQTKRSFPDYKNISYNIEGEIIQLVNSKKEESVAPGSAATIETEYFGNEATGDLNGDGTPDVAFILTQSGGGTGAFFYVVVALKTATGYRGTNAVFLGDRIAPQTTEMRGGKLVVNYADRGPDDPMSEPPSVGKSKYLKVQGQELVAY